MSCWWFEGSGDGKSGGLVALASRDPCVYRKGEVTNESKDNRTKKSATRKCTFINLHTEKNKLTQTKNNYTNRYFQREAAVKL